MAHDFPLAQCDPDPAPALLAEAGLQARAEAVHLLRREAGTGARHGLEQGCAIAAVIEQVIVQVMEEGGQFFCVQRPDGKGHDKS